MKFENFPNLGYIVHQFNNDDLRPIELELQDLDALESANPILAGNIEREYHLTKSIGHIDYLVRPLAEAYIQHWGFYEPHAQVRKPPNELDLVLNTVWVNLQQKNEFNPQHIHYGALSFVLYLNLPFDIQEEKKDQTKTKSENQRWGDFAFIYANALGSICEHTLSIDKRHRGTCLVFPARMNHQVYAFRYARGLRISVSGNYFITDKYPAVAV